MNRIIVVEGIHDEMRIKSIYKDAFVITTGGREISTSTIEMIKHLSLTNEIIIFTDPDYPGEKIRKIIADNVSNCSHAYMDKYKCISKNKKKVGIEHAQDVDIKKALEHVYSNNILVNTISAKDLYSLNLFGKEYSSLLRDNVSAELFLGKSNAKTFLKRINMTGITLDHLKELVNKYEKQYRNV